MTIEELKHIKDIVNRNDSSVFDYTDELLNLLDAEIERQSVTDQDVRDAIDELIKDITDRRGFRQVWDEIDNDTKAEIIDSWTNIFSRSDRKLAEPPIGV